MKMSRDWNHAAKLADMDTARYLFMCDILAGKHKENIILEIFYSFQLLRIFNLESLIDAIKYV